MMVRWFLLRRIDMNVLGIGGLEFLRYKRSMVLEKTIAGYSLSLRGNLPIA